MSIFNSNNTSIQKEQSLFEFVIANIDENGIYNNKDLPDTKPITESPPVFWPLGGKEGLIYDNGIQDSDDEADNVYLLLLKCLADPNARPEMYEKVKNTDCMFYCMPLLRKINDLKTIDRQKFFETAHWLVTHSTDREAVKLGICLMAFFQIDKIKLVNDITVQDVLIRIGLCSEFTYYLFRVLDMQGAPNDLIFAIAKKTTGWGRVFAINQLKPETEEIKRWLFLNGLDDNDYADKFALELAKKCELEKMVTSDTLDPEIYKQTTRIIDYLMERNELEDLNNFLAFIENYLRHSVNLCRDLFSLVTVLTLKDYIFNDENCTEAPETWFDKQIGYLDVIEHVKDWNSDIYKYICKENRQMDWCARWLAKRHSLDVFDILFNRLKEHPEEDELYYDLMKTNDPVRFGQVLEFSEQHIDEYLSGDFSPMFIIQELKSHPHQGEYILEKALCSPGYLHIASCLNVLEAWGAEYIAKPIKDALRAALDIEKNQRSRQRIEKLLMNQIDDGRDFIVKLD